MEAEGSRVQELDFTEIRIPVGPASWPKGPGGDPHPQSLWRPRLSTTSRLACQKRYCWRDWLTVGKSTLFKAIVGQGGAYLWLLV